MIFDSTPERVTVVSCALGLPAAEGTEPPGELLRSLSTLSIWGSTMLRLAHLFIVAVLLAGSANAQSSNAPAEVLTHIPSGAMSAGTWKGQNVYDPSGEKIGEISDVLIDPQGTVAAIILGVGSFLGIPDNDVAVSFTSIRQGIREGKPYLTMFLTKEHLKAAPKFRFDKSIGTWVR